MSRISGRKFPHPMVSCASGQNGEVVEAGSEKYTSREEIFAVHAAGNSAGKEMTFARFQTVVACVFKRSTRQRNRPTKLPAAPPRNR